MVDIILSGETKVDELVESIDVTGFWENIIVRINDDGKPQAAFGHHRLAALRKKFPNTKEFDWNVQPLTDGQMLQMMARENGESYKTNPDVLRETITAAVEALGAGKITAAEMPVEPHTKPELLRYAPGFGSSPPAEKSAQHPYTLNGLAKFLGEVKGSTGEAHEAFRSTFGALELISEGYLKNEWRKVCAH